MGIVVFFLVFTAVSTTLAVLLASVMGYLAVWIVWVSFLAGMAVGFYGYSSSKSLSLSLRPVSFFDGFMLVAFTVFCLRHFLWVYYYRDGGMRILDQYNFSDMPLHLTNVAYFVRGTEFWPDNPIFASLKMHYPFGVDFFTAMWVKIGVPVDRAMQLVGLGGGLLVGIALFIWGRAFALAAFLFSGALHGFQIFLNIPLTDYVTELPWKNLALTLLIPQRGFLFGFSAGLLLLWSWRRRFLTQDKPLPGFVEICLWGLMPLFHFHTFLFLTYIYLIWFLVSGKWTRENLGIALGVSIPALIESFVLTDGFRLASLVWWKPGWLIEGRPLYFFIANFGLWMPLLFLALVFAYRKRRSPKPESDGKLPASCFWHHLWPALLLWAALFFVMLMPWDWDNMKLMVWCYLLILPAVDSLVIQKIPKGWRFLVFFFLFFSGFAVVVSSVGREQKGSEVIRLEELDEVCTIARKMNPGDTVLIYPTFNHPILLCGYKVVAGYGGHTWSHGLPSAEIENKIRRIYLGEKDWKGILREFGPRYLFWGPYERWAYSESTRPWEDEATATLIARGKWGTIYDLSKAYTLQDDQENLTPR
ncbi:MAG: hypothetical protein JW893_01225 [Candidatus Omnitrophica bacterium]|nr:hypothetical protein [Candidatus Omnitrophota bacterium]